MSLPTFLKKNSDYVIGVLALLLLAYAFLNYSNIKNSPLTGVDKTLNPASYPDAEERWLKNNDNVEIRAEVLGRLKNTIKII